MKHDLHILNYQVPKPPVGDFPHDMSLLSAVRNVIDAKEEIASAIVTATTWADLQHLHQICEDIVQGFDHLGQNALRKAEHL